MRIATIVAVALFTSADSAPRSAPMLHNALRTQHPASRSILALKDLAQQTDLQVGLSATQ